MNETFIVVMACLLAYVQLFNKIAGMYFDSNRTLTLEDVYRQIVPPTDFHIQL
jgi:hypothetical protein